MSVFLAQCPFYNKPDITSFLIVSAFLVVIFFDYDKLPSHQRHTLTTSQAASELKTQIVQSPERIRREINDNGARIVKEQSTMSALSQKSAELNTKADFIDQAMTVSK